MTELRHRAGITSSIGTSCNGTKRHPPSTLLLIQSRAEDRPPHRVVRPELKYGKQAWQHAPVMIGPGTTHHLVDAPVQSALRMALLDDRRQLGLTGDRENDIADAPRWFIDRGAGDLDQQALLSIDPLDVFRDIAHHLAFRARSDLVNGFDQQVDHRV